jgi:lysophospholipase L1-like esterase
MRASPNIHISIIVLASLTGQVSFVFAQADPAAVANKTRSTTNAPIDEIVYRGQIKVACIGDSITQGDLTATAGNHPQPYPAHLQQLLGNKYEVTNFGMGGTTLLNKGDSPYQKQEVFRRAKDYQPDVVIIMLGTNDTKPQNWKFKLDFATDYRDLVSQFAALESKPRIFVCHPCYVPGAGNYGINEPDIDAEIPIIDQVASEMRVGIIDVNGATRGHDDLIPDRVHPNNEGALLVAKTVAKELTGKDYNSIGSNIPVPSSATGNRP